MDGCSIDAPPQALLNLPPTAKFPEFPRRFSMRLRAFPPISAGLLAAALAFASLPAAAEDKPIDPCFDGTLTVKEVLDACEAFIAKGNDDKKLLIRAHSVRALGFSATGQLDAALDEMSEAVAIDPKRANSYFMRAAG